MKRFTIIAALLLVAATAAMAQHARRPAPEGAFRTMGGPPPADGLAEYLSLTSEQAANWQAIREETRTQIDALREKERALAEQLGAALEGTDATAIGTLMLQIRGIGSQIEAIRAAGKAKFSATLTAEQKVKFDAFQAAADFLRQRGPGPGPGGRAARP